MKKRTFLFVFALLLLTGLAAIPAAAQDDMLPPVVPGVWTDPDWLKIDYHRVNITVDQQIATTAIDLQFTNEGDGLAEGTFLFPLPEGAAVDELIMYVDGQAIEARILTADAARGIYDEIVRQYRDPALLEYVGTGAIQANVFPIPPGDSRRIEISYTQVLEAENGLVKVSYPLDSTGVNSSRAVEQMSVSVDVTGNDEISSIYSPTHQIATVRDGDTAFRSGFEQSFFVADGDFTLYYGLAGDAISLNMLSYRESADGDGFFMLLVQPPLTIDEAAIIPKDVIIVLDQSGSMEGPKWDQARAATAYVLDNLNAEDRFNLVLFSTGARVYSTAMESPAQAEGAIDWINTQVANGGTDINLALTRALDLVESDRPTSIIFLTDGLATEGTTAPDDILTNLAVAAKPNARIFSFGIGDNVDTFLLDSIVRDFRGAGSYVRTGERIDEEVASLYNKISAPVLTDITLDFGDVNAELLYPQQLPDLFAGEQLTVVGRYRGAQDDVTITLSGTVNDETRTYSYDDNNFRARAGGEPFIARLWATRRIGDMLNNIRLNGENPELVDSIIDLSVRYGIITPYTSFLIEEDDILTQTGRDRAQADFAGEAEELAESRTGAAAVDAADDLGAMGAAEAPMAPPPTTQATGGADMGGGGNGMAMDEEAEGMPEDGAAPGGAITTINDKTFIVQNGIWTDTTFQPDTMTTEPVVFLSDEYFALLDEVPALAPYFALGERVIVVIDGTAYEVTNE